ncbi:hypothetical protein CQ052_05090 [Ochrobactrum sp. MYb15]|nr:hypothetical protein CQZ90_03800 [Ochrobactrum sp. MYb19]PRA62606.1 hypothetical protein CQ053_17185 [Ochrobactrum sp. MYb18]PRA76740.1 hypothetical protein CQ049_05090 [Brucella thiophenivorans]PRA93626.1 hypothetical protein CQ051_03800 [Ochrobactrum sp. MYb14]PRA98747.1 hypothetical protein CQ052_05090 [Ochrobactrum sp. MYb15]
MALLPSQSVTFSVFFSGTHPQNPSELFVKAFGVEPEGVQTNRSGMVAGSPFIGIATGASGENFARIHISHGRIDFIVEPIIPNDANSNSLVFTISTDVALSFLQQAVSKVIPEMANIVRVAIITNLVDEQSSADSAVSAIFSKVGIKFPAEDLTDVSFQLNKRLRLSNGIQANRLMRYNVVAFQKMFFNGSEPVPVSDERFSMLLTLDLNTVVDGTKFDANQTIDIIGLLIEETIRITRAGDPSALLA